MRVEEKATPERDQTDESLRVERRQVDDGITAGPASFDDQADEVIEKARRRADAVLARSRAKSDRRSATPRVGAGQENSETVARARRIEDDVVEMERADADALVASERVKQAAVLEKIREETDEDLSRERSRADVTVAARDEVLGVVSHDLRNMLGAVLGFAKLILRESSPEQIRQYALRIDRAGARMNRLVGDLVDLASIDAGRLTVRPELSSPSEVVAEAIDTFQTLARTKDISLVEKPGPPLPAAPFDPARILQVLVNLINNGLKFTPAGGSVTVSVESVGDDLRFSVSDTGQGIPSDNLETIFERFAQVDGDDRRGEGLGLYISKCIVRGHGGVIWATSEMGRGTTIRFTLPLASKPETHEPGLG